MARYREYDYSQGKFIPIFFDKEILPGTFERTLHYLIDQEIDLSIFEGRCNNDETGAPHSAFRPPSSKAFSLSVPISARAEKQ